MTNHGECIWRLRQLQYQLADIQNTVRALTAAIEKAQAVNPAAFAESVSSADIEKQIAVTSYDLVGGPKSATSNSKSDS